MRYPTASALERALACAASHVLPKVYDDASPWAAEGQALNEALDAHMAGQPYPSELRAWAEAAVDEAGPILRDKATLIQPAYLYDPDWARAEYLGSRIGRNYGTATSRGYAGSADYVRVSDGVVEVLDLKTGYGEVTPPASNPQLLFLARCASLLSGKSSARVGLLFAPRDAPPRVEWEDVGPEAFRSFEDSLDQLTEVLRSKATPEAYTGPHCRYCKARAACPAKAEAEKEALALPQSSRIIVTKDNAGEVWAKVDAAREVLDELKTACIKVALAEGGVTLPNGKRRHQVTRETDVLDAETVWRVLSARWGPEVAKTGVTLDASKASVQRAAKAAKELGAEGTAAGLAREVVDAVRATGGVEKKTRSEWVDE